NPLVNPRLSRDGTLTFEDAAQAAGVAQAPAEYRADWRQFENGSGETRHLGETHGPRAAVPAPQNLPQAPGDVVEIDVTGMGSAPPAWQSPARLHFLRTGP